MSDGCTPTPHRTPPVAREPGKAELHRHDRAAGPADHPAIYRPRIPIRGSTDRPLSAQTAARASGATTAAAQTGTTERFRGRRDNHFKGGAFGASPGGRAARSTARLAGPRFWHMDDRPTLQQRLDWLHHGEVLPVLLATDTSYGEDFRVHIVLLDPDEAGPDGYSSIRVMTRTYPDPPDSVETERTRRSETVIASRCGCESYSPVISSGTAPTRWWLPPGACTVHPLADQGGKGTIRSQSRGSGRG
jgi:hypothetical protein